MSYFVVNVPKFTGLSSDVRGRNRVDHVSFRFWISPSVPEMLAILHVFAPQFFRGRAPKFFDRYYKIEHTVDHVAKFEGISTEGARRSRDKIKEKKPQ